MTNSYLFNNSAQKLLPALAATSVLPGLAVFAPSLLSFSPQGSTVPWMRPNKSRAQVRSAHKPVLANSNLRQ